MNQFMGINAVHLDYLTPLLKWKIMDIRSLLKASTCPSHYVSFARVIRRLQSFGILESIVEPISRKKYVYFSEVGLKVSSGNNKLLFDSGDSPIHDAKSSELSRKFLELDTIDRVMMEHEHYSKNSIIPDASFYGQKNGRNFSIAFELEITRKSRSRLIGKIKSYFTRTDYDYVIYFFASSSLLDSYVKFVEEDLGERYLNRIMFASNPKIFNGNYQLEESEVLFKGERKKLGDIFGQK
ncbi:MAG: hypothetical protein KAG61_08370 [Bacteriovoracaceae bacterium]|nr:hypothetical protein [Bacteriovoracaceae bacterium]